MGKSREKSDDTAKIGLSTKEALQILWEEIHSTTRENEKLVSHLSWIRQIKTIFNNENPLHWFSILTTLFCIGCLVIAKHFYSAAFVGAVLFVTVLVVIREFKLRQTEIFRKVQYVLDDITDAINLSKGWKISNFPHLCSPLSPCVTLQWTYRDGEIVNLPWALLVRGDHIVVRPGQTAPGFCKEVNGTRQFKSGETYTLTNAIHPPQRPTARMPLENLICVMETTPYLENLNLSFDKFLDKPQSIHNQQRHFLVSVCVQRWGSLLALLIVLICGSANASRRGEKFQWENVFFENAAVALVPILPLFFPIVWIGLNLWGTAKMETLISIPKPFEDNESQKSFQMDVDTVDWDNMRLPMRWNIGNFIQLLKGSAHLLGRSVNVVQVLGSVTALTCVDKRGILSWPNPTAEKIFFLRDGSSVEKDIQDESSCSSSVDLEPSKPEKMSTVAEVLDLTHDQHSPFRLEFDDHEWKNHINSLKPLGLAILVNTCCPLTQAYYSKFCGHVTAVSLFDKDLVPVTNRRCLCELAKQIGFTKQARDIFTLEGKIACYRHLQPDVVRRDIRFARSLQIASKVKVPFPHSLSVVMKEVGNGSLQLLTQGTADIILDCCDDFWDGKDLQPLRPQDRKRAQDFYQRNALTAYCTAFAYRPLRHGIFGALAGSQENIAYLELPPETKQRMQHDEKYHCDFVEHDPLSHSISADSLLFSEVKEEDVSDVEGCFEMQCHQVFIGMVTMQYQAQTDIVQLIERLDKACIRFVHFSKENELRSRVFSEKMGLESGWNCHISLLSDEDSAVQSPKTSRNISTSQQLNQNTKNSTDIKKDLEANSLMKLSTLESCKNLSCSAPGAISNQESYLLSNHPEEDSLLDAGEPNQRSSEDSIMNDGTENAEVIGRSLSCLTDSTEQSVPVHFDMSNRAKLPRGIENIRPHLENVDNVPLLVSLFTDCSAEATKEMLKIMQSYGEVVVCLGSSANATNVEIFLQGDCSIGIEPLYPQVCQDFPAYTETNILHNKKAVKPKSQLLQWFPPTDNKNKTISPVYLSRMMNSICCSISVCRDDPWSIVALIELARRFTMGLWNCIQFMVCAACSLTVINLLGIILALPPVFPPATILYLMCFAIPLTSTSLARISSDPKVMSKATGKKQTKIGSRLVMFVVWCYGTKFVPLILFVILGFCGFLSHPITFIKSEEEDFEDNLKLARIVLLFATVLHFVVISSSFVHRDFLFWKRNAFKNKYWTYSSLFLLTCHSLLMIGQIVCDSDMEESLRNKWPVVVFVLCSSVLTFVFTELCKWQEIKANLRYQRRARLDFGTKLGMNSPF